jgi:Ca-activated chloride channel homolog
LSFAHPGYLWLLVALVPLSAWVARGRRRRARDWAALGQEGRPRGDGGLGWLGAIALLVVALAQPRWGRLAGPPRPPGHDVVLLVDLSRSMGAEDAVPSRLGAAVEAAEGLVRALGREPGSRAAVVAFAGRGVTRCPLTENLGAVVEALRALRPGDVRPGGTDLGAGLDEALARFDAAERDGGRTIVVFSDGEDHAGTWRTALGRLRDAGAVVHAVAVGDDAKGHPVPSGRGSGTLTFRGSTVLSRRSDAALEGLAHATGGAIVRLGLASGDLGALYLSRIAPGERRARLEARPPERAERYGLFVLAALAVGLVGSYPRRGRWPGPRRLAVAAALAAIGASSRDETPRDAVAAGQSAFAAGRFDEALAAFERAVALDPDGAVPRYDAAAALFRLGRFPEAMARYGEARERASRHMRTKIDYALGNTALALGDPLGAIRHYDACLASTAPGPDLVAVRRDAAINRRFAEEQARRPPAPPDPDRASKAPPDRPKPQEPGGRGEDRGPSGPQAPGGSRDPATSDRRGPGGAGGTGPAPPRPGSPEARLAAALDDIRDARRRRIADEVPPADEDRKDW